MPCMIMQYKPYIVEQPPMKLLRARRVLHDTLVNPIIRTVKNNYFHKHQALNRMDIVVDHPGVDSSVFVKAIWIKKLESNNHTLQVHVIRRSE